MIDRVLLRITVVGVCRGVDKSLSRRCVRRLCQAEQTVGHLLLDEKVVGLVGQYERVLLARLAATHRTLAIDHLPLPDAVLAVAVRACEDRVGLGVHANAAYVFVYRLALVQRLGRLNSVHCK